MKRNFKRNFVKNGSGGGSLPFDDLQDLDRELELLRRKRQMLENQQQYQGGQGFSRPSPWEQAPRVNEYVAPNRTFSQPQYAGLYDSARQSAPSWQEPAAKRFRQPDYVPRPFQSQRPQHFTPPKTYTPPANFAGPKRTKGFVHNKPGFVHNKPVFANQKPGFANPKPNSVTPKQKFAPKPATPAPKANKATPPARRPVVPGEPKVVRFLDFVVKDDNEPFPSVVKGRLEAVLGELYRGVKERTGEVPLELSKFVKQVLRDRIRKAMLGKPLGTAQNVVSQYSKAHPRHDDAVVLRLAKVNQAKVAQDQEPVDESELEKENPYLKNIVATAGSPELYFMQNMEVVITNKIDEIFQRLQKTYEKENQDSLQNLIQEVDQIAKEQAPEKADETATGDVVMEVHGAENGENASEVKAGDETVEKVQTEPAENNADATEPSGEPDIAATTRDDYYSKLMQALITRELPVVLPSFKDDLVNMLAADIKYSYAQKIIAKQAAVIPRVAPKKAVCYVMILGDPQLPRKERLQVFLNKFHPASIKRHRRVRNVLYIGFSDKQDFDNILTEDGLVLTNMTLCIKESKSCRENHFTIQKGVAKLLDTPAGVEAEATEAIADNASADNTPADNTSVANETVDDQSLIDSDIDGQINDLLCSIDENNTSADVTLDEDADNQASEAVEASDDVTEMAEATETAVDNNGVAEVSDAVVETPEEVANGEENPEVTEEAKDRLCEVVKTPTRTSNRLAGGIQTRRASRLAQ